MPAMKTFYNIFLLIFIACPKLYATHLLGGEIRAAHVSGQTYKVAVHVYLDMSNGASAASAMQSINICYGDGQTSEIPRVSSSSLPGNMSVGVFEKTYTYSSSGTFQISASINSRTSGYLNLANVESENLFLWTVVDTQSQNTTPILPYPKLSAGVRQVYSLDLKPAVSDKDSITIGLQSVSKPSPGTCGVRSLQSSFFYPNDLTKTGTFKIDQKNKKLIWNAPERVGRYIYSFVVYEWRDGIVISESYHEGTIVVADRPGDQVTIPDYEPAGSLITSIPPATENSAEVSMTLDAYPVPTEDFLSFKVYSKKRSTMQVRLFNLQGQMVRQMFSKEPSLLFQDIFDMRLLPKGLYVIKAENSEQSVSQKVVR
jgi:hypothetical protein